MVLLDLAERYGVPDANGAITLSLPLTQQELATMIGRARETVARALTVWRRTGVVSTHRMRLFIRNPDALREVADAPSRKNPAANNDLGVHIRPRRSALIAGNFMAMRRGGVGLNSQTASVIIIAEPQLTPSIEEQAIARAHRMGQVRRVDVHRLRCEDRVDQRVLELLVDKREAFDEYARHSDMANATPDAVDSGSETEVRRRSVASEQMRLKAA